MLRIFHNILILLPIVLVTPAFSATSKPKLPATGQTTSYAAGDDGDLQTGMPWPEPRFTDNGNGTVTDNLTGLIWLKNANCFGTQTWATAITSANTLASGACGLTDGSSAGQWRLPNINELESLVNEQQANPATWLNGQGFSGVQGTLCWSSSTVADGTSSAWVVYMFSGYVGSYRKYYSYDVWPVRGGQ